jgi:hypothetical protein
MLIDELRDADGWIVVWDLTSRRPLAVWKGHESSILSVCEWTAEKLITYLTVQAHLNVGTVGMAKSLCGSLVKRKKVDLIVGCLLTEDQDENLGCYIPLMSMM